jgi:glyoxylase-like metal-dependent hydrolase (beta-lactamase superfamily II)
LEEERMSHHTRRDLLAISALAASSVATRQVLAAAPLGAQSPPSAYRYKIGSFEVTSVYDGVRRFPLPPNFVANAAPEQVRSAFSDAMRPTDTVDNPFTPTVINTGSRLVLVDAGNGPQPAGATMGRLVENMKGAGLAPEHIDLVIISHFHPDHILGLRTADGQPTFPNAEVAVPERELAFWFDEGEESRAVEARKANFPLARRIFAPGASRVRTYKGGEEVIPGITAIEAPGHSPGHMAFRVQSGTEGLLLLGDAAHLPFLFVRNPDWTPSFDMDRELARQTRRKLLDQAAADRLPVAAYHWGFPNVGYVKQVGTGFELIRMAFPA